MLQDWTAGYLLYTRGAGTIVGQVYLLRWYDNHVDYVGEINVHDNRIVIGRKLPMKVLHLI